MPRKKSPATNRRISAERNLESWSLWQPADSRASPRNRTLIRQIKHPDGQILTATVELRYDSQLGPLTTEDEKVCYGLIRMWDEDGRPDELIFSLRRLARTLKRKWGKNQIEDLKLSLRRLISVPITWTNAFCDGVTRRRFKSLSEFHILSFLYIAETEDSEHSTTERCKVEFHKTVLQNLRAFYTKPVLFDTILGFKSGIAQVVYRYVDPMLVSRDRYVRRTADLFADLGLDADRYRKQSNRRTALERAFKEINGAPLSEGGVLRCRIEEAKGGDDLLAVFTKSKQLASASARSDAPQTALGTHPPSEPSRTQPRASQGPKRGRPEAVAPDPAADLVRYFHTTFHGLAPDACRPTAKELGQARDLLTRAGGLDAARSVVDYALAEARKTAYRPATFGGILQYVDCALDALRSGAAEPADAERAEETTTCGICDGAGRLVVRWLDGRVQLVPCPHDRTRVDGWVEERPGLSIEREDGQPARPKP